jgi:hypothetical protein
MAHINQTPPGRAGLGNAVSFGGNGAESTNPARAAQARAALIREALADDLDRIVMFAETGLIAIDTEDDHTAVRMVDQAVKVFLSAVSNIKELIEAREVCP